MSKTIKALVVTPDMSISLQDIEGGGNDLRELVGGWIECPPCSDTTLSFWINEEGKLNGLPFNQIATGMWYATTPMMIGHDHLVGTVVITGGVDRHGNTMTLPKDWSKKFAEFITFEIPEDDE